MGKSEHEIITDAGPIIHLAELDALVALSGFAKIIVPLAVVEEVNQHQPEALSQLPEPYSSPPSPPSSPYLQTLFRALALDRGEVDSLCLLQNFPEGIFLTDDSAARLAAEQSGYRVHGTIGLLIRTVRKEIYSPEKVLQLMDQIPGQSTLYIRTTLLEEIKNKLISEWKL